MAVSGMSPHKDAQNAPLALVELVTSASWKHPVRVVVVIVAVMVVTVEVLVVVVLEVLVVVLVVVLRSLITVSVDHSPMEAMDTVIGREDIALAAALISATRAPVLAVWAFSSSAGISAADMMSLNAMSTMPPEL
mmetsp:Transcript_44912/g.118670  ORF Transcript_44912/g.118670 Transcript_44912/m.118670 type:complete len:135 (-) Transcript_44912:71-475(-)